MGSEPQSPDGQATRKLRAPGLLLAAPATPNALRITTQANGTVDWPSAASAAEPNRMVPLSSDSLPIKKPGQSARCTTGRWKVDAVSSRRMSLRQLSAVQPPPYT